MKKRLLLIIALLFLTPALLATATTETMPGNTNNSPAFDADTDDWSNWFDTDNFQPLDNSWAARRDIATAILVMGREPNLLTQNGNVPTNFAFADVPRSSFAFPSISWAAQRGWISHSASARFRPDDHITREEAIAMLVNSHPTTLPETGDLSRFSDQHLISAWARPFISRAVGAGWISGYPDGTFRPQGQITRANMIAVVRNATSRTVVIPGLFGITWQPHGGTAVDWWQRFGGHAIGPLPTTTRGTSPFIGWYRNNAKITQNTTQSQQNVTHSARWTITVTWNANGGTVSPGSRQQSSDAPVGTLPTPNQRTNHDFVAWYTAQNGGTRISATSWTPHNNVTYWARWREHPPDTPGQPTVSNINQVSATVSWDAVARATSYRVYLDGVLNATVTGTSRTISGLNPNTQYSVRIRAVNASGQSGQSTARTFRTLALTGVHPTVPNTPRGPFLTADAAAFAWSQFIYSTSLFVRHEHAVVIYRTPQGMYRLTRTQRGDPHSVLIPFADVPSGVQRVAFVHTHPNHPAFTDGDLLVARLNSVNAYVFAPTTTGNRTSFHLRRYTRLTSTESRVGNTHAFSSLRALSVLERAELRGLYSGTWNNHLPCTAGFGCNTMAWPTSPWPPQ